MKLQEYSDPTELPKAIPAVGSQYAPTWLVFRTYSDDSCQSLNTIESGALLTCNNADTFYEGNYATAAWWLVDSTDGTFVNTPGATNTVDVWGAANFGVTDDKDDTSGTTDAVCSGTPQIFEKIRASADYEDYDFFKLGACVKKGGGVAAIKSYKVSLEASALSQEGSAVGLSTWGYFSKTSAVTGTVSENDCNNVNLQNFYFWAPVNKCFVMAYGEYADNDQRSGGNNPYEIDDSEGGWNFLIKSCDPSAGAVIYQGYSDNQCTDLSGTEDGKPIAVDTFYSTVGTCVADQFSDDFVGSTWNGYQYALMENQCTFKTSLISLKDLLALLCFSGSESVQLESGASKPLSEVSVGDRVLAASADGKTLFSPVVAMPHALNEAKAVFQHISAASGRDIKLTPLHLIANGACGSGKFSLVQANTVQVGSCLRSVDGEERVVSNEAVQGAGAYSLVTQEALVVVNGFVASPFAENHAVGNAYYNIHRALALMAPGLLQSSWAKAANLAFGQIASAL